MTNSKLFIAFLAAITASTVAVGPAYAGGSSLAVYTQGKTAFVRQGRAVSTLQQINIDTYFMPEYWPVKMLRVDKLTVDCSGDNVMKSASVSLGAKNFGSAIFKRVPKKTNLYEAVIQPKNLVLLNDSFYSLDINGQTRNLGSALRVATCVMKEIRLSMSSDGITFNPTVGGYDVDGFAVTGDPSPSAVVVGSLWRFAESKAGAAFDLKRPAKAFANGAIEDAGDGKYTINVFSWNKGSYDFHVSNDGQKSAAPFDLLNPTAEQKASTNPYQAWSIQEAHMYASPAANGSVGSIILGKKL